MHVAGIASQEESFFSGWNEAFGLRAAGKWYRLVQIGTAQKRYLYHRKALLHLALEKVVEVV